MNTPKISVVTVCYNVVTTIEKTIQSVINQTYDNIEYIIIDGASTDGTVELINKYRDKISYYVSEPDKGIYDAMNKAIDVATGEWINFMNAGDMFADKEVISRIMCALRACDKHDVVFGNTIYYNDKLRTYRKGTYRESNMPQFVHQSSFVYTRLMKKYHFNQKYSIGADHDFFYKLYQEGKSFYHIDETISMFSLDGASFKNRYVVYKEVCEIENMEPQLLKLVKYRLEDLMPSWIIKIIMPVLMKRIC